MESLYHYDDATTGLVAGRAADPTLTTTISGATSTQPSDDGLGQLGLNTQRFALAAGIVCDQFVGLNYDEQLQTFIGAFSGMSPNVRVDHPSKEAKTAVKAGRAICRQVLKRRDQIVFQYNKRNCPALTYYDNASDMGAVDDESNGVYLRWRVDYKRFFYVHEGWGLVGDYYVSPRDQILAGKGDPASGGSWQFSFNTENTGLPFLLPLVGFGDSKSTVVQSSYRKNRCKDIKDFYPLGVKAVSTSHSASTACEDKPNISATVTQKVYYNWRGMMQKIEGTVDTYNSSEAGENSHDFNQATFSAEFDNVDGSSSSNTPNAYCHGNTYEKQADAQCLVYHDQDPTIDMGRNYMSSAALEWKGYGRNSLQTLNGNDGDFISTSGQWYEDLQHQDVVRVVRLISANGYMGELAHLATPRTDWIQESCLCKQNLNVCSGVCAKCHKTSETDSNCHTGTTETTEQSLRYIAFHPPPVLRLDQEMYRDNINEGYMRDIDRRGDFNLHNESENVYANEKLQFHSYLHNTFSKDIKMYCPHSSQIQWSFINWNTDDMKAKMSPKMETRAKKLRDELTSFEDRMIAQEANGEVIDYKSEIEVGGKDNRVGSDNLAIGYLSKSAGQWDNATYDTDACHNQVAVDHDNATGWEVRNANAKNCDCLMKRLTDLKTFHKKRRNELWAAEDDLVQALRERFIANHYALATVNIVDEMVMAPEVRYFKKDDICDGTENSPCTEGKTFSKFGADHFVDQEGAPMIARTSWGWLHWKKKLSEDLVEFRMNDRIVELNYQVFNTYKNTCGRDGECNEVRRRRQRHYAYSKQLGEEEANAKDTAVNGQYNSINNQHGWRLQTSTSIVKFEEYISVARPLIFVPVPTTIKKTSHGAKHYETESLELSDNICRTYSYMCACGHERTCWHDAADQSIVHGGESLKSYTCGEIGQQSDADFWHEKDLLQAIGNVPGTTQSWEDYYFCEDAESCELRFTGENVKQAGIDSKEAENATDRNNFVNAFRTARFRNRLLANMRSVLGVVCTRPNFSHTCYDREQVKPEAKEDFQLSADKNYGASTSHMANKTASWGTCEASSGGHCIGHSEPIDRLTTCLDETVTEEVEECTTEHAELKTAMVAQTSHQPQTHHCSDGGCQQETKQEDPTVTHMHEHVGNRSCRVFLESRVTRQSDGYTNTDLARVPYNAQAWCSDSCMTQTLLAPVQIATVFTRARYVTPAASATELECAAYLSRGTLEIGSNTEESWSRPINTWCMIRGLIDGFRLEDTQRNDNNKYLAGRAHEDNKDKNFDRCYTDKCQLWDTELVFSEAQDEAPLFWTGRVQGWNGGDIKSQDPEPTHGASEFSTDDNMQDLAARMEQGQLDRVTEVYSYSAHAQMQTRSGFFAPIFSEMLKNPELRQKSGKMGETQVAAWTQGCGMQGKEPVLGTKLRHTLTCKCTNGTPYDTCLTEGEHTCVSCHAGYSLQKCENSNNLLCAPSGASAAETKALCDAAAASGSIAGKKLAGDCLHHGCEECDQAADQCTKAKEGYVLRDTFNGLGDVYKHPYPESFVKNNAATIDALYIELEQNDQQITTLQENVTAAELALTTAKAQAEQASAAQAKASQELLDSTKETLTAQQQAIVEEAEKAKQRADKQVADAQARYNETKATLEAELAKLQETLKNTQNESAKALHTEREALRQANTSISSLEAKVAELQGANASLQSEGQAALEDAETEEEKLKKQLAAEKAARKNDNDEADDEQTTLIVLLVICIVLVALLLLGLVYKMTREGNSSSASGTGSQKARGKRGELDEI
jgi:hypothetical protein